MNLAESCKKIVVIQAGCGGTGSWLVPLISKLLNNIKLRLINTEISYILSDDDCVEQRNILRQNFNEWDIGKGKAMALVSKYCYNFENMIAVSKRIKSKNDLYSIIFPGINYYANRQKTLVIIIGCVDHNPSRHLFDRLSKSFNKDHECPIVYIDSGNLLYNGQVITISHGFNEFLTKTTAEYEPDRAYAISKQIKKYKKINLKKMFPIEKEVGEVQNCAFFGDQSQAINSLSANIIFCCLQKILVTSELPPQMITFNSSGYSTFEV